MTLRIVGREWMKIINLKGDAVETITAIVKVEWCTTFEAKTKKQFVQMCKEQFKDDYNIDLVDDEIQIMEDK